jgi:hypothetical protein
LIFVRDVSFFAAAALDPATVEIPEDIEEIYVDLVPSKVRNPSGVTGCPGAIVSSVIFPAESERLILLMPPLG